MRDVATVLGDPEVWSGDTIGFDERSIRVSLDDFINYESKLLDERRYTEWENLWADDACYWIPSEFGQISSSQISIIFDNRSRIARRVKQLGSGLRHVQIPPSVVRRIVGNRLYFDLQNGTYGIEASFYAIATRHDTTVWGGRIRYLVQASTDEIRLSGKRVDLTNASTGAPPLGFLL